MKIIAASSVLVTLLCGPALADPAAVQLKLAVTSGKTVRNYDTALVDNTCGEVKHDEPKLRDQIKTCMHAEGAKLRLEVEWNLIDGDRELHNRFVTLVDHGSKAELASDGAKLAIVVR